TVDAAEQAALRELPLGRAVALSSPADPTAAEAAIQRAELGDATLDSLLADLAKTEADAKPNANDTPPYLKLKALVYLQPEACPRLAEVLNKTKTDGPTMQLLTGALSSVGHAEAQSALQQAIRARGDDFTTLAVLIPALGLVDNPTPQSEELLRELSGRGDVNIRTTAQLALGVMARNLSDTAPERTARIVRDALRQLEGATQADERRQMLLGLGNSAGAGTLDAIRKTCARRGAGGALGGGRRATLA